MWRPAAAAIRWPFVPMSAPRCRCCKPRWVAPGWRRRPRPCGARCWPCCAGTCRPPGPNGAPASGRPSNICSATAFASHMPTGRRVWLRGGWGGWGGGGGPAIEHRQRHGFCVSQADWQSDVYAVAVPLNAPADAEPVVINCGVPIRSLRPGELQSRVAPRLMALARRIEAHWRAATQPAMPVALPLEVVHGAVSGTVSHAHTLSRGLDLLQCFRPGEVQLGHAELTRRLRLPGPIVVRLTHTLGALGYLRRGAAGSGYRLGAATVALGYPLLAHLRARKLARPGMMALSERVGGAVSL